MPIAQDAPVMPSTEDALRAAAKAGCTSTKGESTQMTDTKTRRVFVALDDGRTRLEPVLLARLSSLVGDVLARYPIRRAWLYGSVARGVYTDESDVDLIIEGMEGSRITFALMDSLQAELESALGVDVDINTLCRPRAGRLFLRNFDMDKVIVYERKT